MFCKNLTPLVVFSSLYRWRNWQKEIKDPKEWEKSMLALTVCPYSAWCLSQAPVATFYEALKKVVR